MDPFVQYQNNVQSDTIKAQIAALLRNLNIANDGNQAHLDAFLERPADPIQDVITAFNFVIPQFSLDQVFALPAYARPKHMIHYRKENGKNYYNTNQNSFAYQDPDGAAALAQNRLLDRDANAAREEWVNAGTAAKNRAILANIAAAAIPPTWVLCKRTEPNDVRAEEPLIVFTDDVRKIVDWHQFALNLKELGESLGYTEAHYNQAIRRLVSFYEPALMPSLRGQTATNQAKFLLSLKPPTPLKQQQFKDIQALTRKANTELRITMNILENLASGYYIDEPLDRRSALVNQLMIKGLQSFTTGPTHTALRQALQNNVNCNQPSEHQSLTKATIAMEEIHGKPQEDLSYATSQMASVALFQTNIETNTAVFDPVLGQIEPCHPTLQMTPHYASYQPQYSQTTADYSYAQFTPAYIAPRPLQADQPQEIRPHQPEPTTRTQQADNFFSEKESDNDSRSSTPTAKDLAKQLKQLQDSIQTLYLNNSLPIGAKDRNYRTPSRTEREQQSEKNSSNRNNSQRYNRSRSYERNKRTPSPYNRDSRNDSRNRNTNSSSSRSNYYRNNSPYKDSRSRDRSNSPYRSPGNSSNYRNSSQYRNRSTSPAYRSSNRNRESSHSNYRSSSPRSQDSYRQEMNPGTNCHPKYDKNKGRSCSKCNIHDEHHEYQCPTYRMWVPDKCRICNGGYHAEKACRKQRNSRSPTPNRNSKNY
jgi:hypothetical protein